MSNIHNVPAPSTAEAAVQVTLTVNGRNMESGSISLQMRKWTGRSSHRQECCSFIASLAIRASIYRGKICPKRNLPDDPAYRTIVLPACDMWTGSILYVASTGNTSDTVGSLDNIIDRGYGWKGKVIAGAFRVMSGFNTIVSLLLPQQPACDCSLPPCLNLPYPCKASYLHLR